MLRRFLVFFLIFSLLTIVFSVPPKNTQAASLLALSDTMSRQDDDIDANHTIQFDLVSTWDAGETVVVDFVDADGWDTTGLLNSDDNDFDISWEGANKEVVANGACAANRIEITTVNTATDTFTFTLCATSTASAATDTVVIKIGTHANQEGSGDTAINNATDAGSKIITITGPGVDTGSLAVPILTSDQVNVSATVDPSITSTLSGAGYPNCTLGLLSFAAVQGCTYTNTVDTNATSGYNSTIVEDGNLCSPSVAVCTNNITDVADGTVTINTLEYGVSTSDANAPGITADFDGTCDDGANETGSAITGAAQIYADETAPIASDATNLCHSASITATTPSGSYSHIVTHITTGNF